MDRKRNTKGQYDKRATGSVVDRFMSRVSPEPISGCWLWVGAEHGAFGYGAFKWGSRKTRTETTHRVSYKLFKGDIPGGKLVRHLCNNPACVNPEHLELGTHKENAHDKVAAGTLLQGEKHYFAKITADVVKAMRSCAERAQGVSLGKAAGLSRQAAHDIMSHRTWKHVV